MLVWYMVIVVSPRWFVVAMLNHQLTGEEGTEENKFLSTLSRVLVWGFG